MLNCLYNGKRVNALFIAEECEYKYRKEIKIASSKKELACEDCGSPMTFKCGQVITPHFAHWRGYGEKCPYNMESEALRRCKKILYNYFRENYPKAEIELEYKAIPNRRSDLFICFNDGSKLVIDIQKDLMSARQWDDKHSDYKKAAMNNLWIVNGVPKSEKERSMPFFEQIMVNESTDGIAVFLNHETEEVTLIKKLVYNDEKNNKEYSELFERTYPLNDILILPTGSLKTSFHDEVYSQEQIFCKRWAEKLKEKERQHSAISEYNKLKSYISKRIDINK